MMAEARTHMGKGEKVLVALGGNAILSHKEKGTAEDQFRNVRETAKHMVELIEDGCRIALTHGNGPQVGDILLKNELAKATLPPMPLDVCGAESQGLIGYMLQQCVDSELKLRGLDVPTQTILTQTLVDPSDPAFGNPSKPIGPFYTAMEASKLREEKGWMIVNDAGRGYSRVVPSPNPIALIEARAIKHLFDEGFVVIAAGGGGIPVVRDEKGELRGLEAVIDKDHTAAVLAKVIEAETLLILTDVEKVALNFGKPNEKGISEMTVDEARRYSAEGHFAPGSMQPKIEAAILFLESGGRDVVITSIGHGREALKSRAGTKIHR